MRHHFSMHITDTNELDVWERTVPDILTDTSRVEPSDYIQSPIGTRAKIHKGEDESC